MGAAARQPIAKDTVWTIKCVQETYFLLCNWMTITSSSRITGFPTYAFFIYFSFNWVSRTVPLDIIQSFLKFHGFNFQDFLFTMVYDSILFSFPLVLLSSLNLRGVCFWGFIFVSPHWQRKWGNACNVLKKTPLLSTIRQKLIRSQNSKSIRCWKFAGC